MKKLKHVIVTMFVLLLGIQAKGNGGWSHVLYSHDALLYKFDRELNRGRRGELVRQMYSVCSKHPGNKVILVRTQIQEAQYNKKVSDNLLRNLNGLDSVDYRYERMRVKTLETTRLSDYDFRKYRSLCELRRYYKNIGDTLMTANVCNSLASMLDNLGEKKEAFKLFKESAAMYNSIGFFDAYIRNMLNIANQYYFCGNAKAACRIIRNIGKDRRIERDSVFLVNLYMSLYSYSSLKSEQDIASRKALSLSYGLGDETLMLMCKANRGDFFLKNNQTDSAYHYLKDCFNRRNELGDFKYIYDMDVTATQLFEKMGLTDSAYVYLKHAETMRDSIDKTAVTTKIRQSETVAEIGKYEAKMKQMEKNKRRNEFLFALLMFMVSAVSSVVCILLYHKWRKKHIEVEAKSLENQQLFTEIESKDRELTTSAIIIEESHTALKNVRQVLEKSRKEGDISQHYVNEMASIINCYTDSDNDWEAFKSHFNKVHPELLDRMKSAHPNLTDADLKLCAFLYLGIETKHIAKILSVQPDSVKKARQRLRKKLGIGNPAVRIQDYMRTSVMLKNV